MLMFLHLIKLCILLNELVSTGMPAWLANSDIFPGNVLLRGE